MVHDRRDAEYPRTGPLAGTRKAATPIADTTAPTESNNSHDISSRPSTLMVERRQQDRLLNAIRQAGATGVALRDLYRNLNFSAKQARQLAQDLVRAGLIEERRMERAEWFIAVEHVSEQA